MKTLGGVTTAADTAGVHPSLPKPPQWGKIPKHPLGLAQQQQQWQQRQTGGLELESFRCLGFSFERKSISSPELLASWIDPDLPCTRLHRQGRGNENKPSPSPDSHLLGSPRPLAVQPRVPPAGPGRRTPASGCGHAKSDEMCAVYQTSYRL